MRTYLSYSTNLQWRLVRIWIWTPVNEHEMKGDSNQAKDCWGLTMIDLQRVKYLVGYAGSFRFRRAFNVLYYFCIIIISIILNISFWCVLYSILLNNNICLILIVLFWLYVMWWSTGSGIVLSLLIRAYGKFGSNVRI